MTVRIEHGGVPMASVQLWGKGFRVTADTEEFQRFVPLEGSLNRLESVLASAPWGKVLEPLYSLPLRELSSQRCVLLDSGAVMAVAFAPTEDRHGRPSIVLTTASIPVSWDADNLGLLIGRAVSLTHRLADSYANVVRRNPPAVQKQLRANTFLRSRLFDLNEEPPDAMDWERAIAAVKLWRGVTGLCTPRMANLGANIMLGTRHEAESAKRHQEVDGYFDVRDGEIHPLSSRIDRWAKGESPASGQASAAVPDLAARPSDLAPIAESLDRIERTLDRLADIGGRLVDLGAHVLEHVLKDKRRR